MEATTMEFWNSSESSTLKEISASGTELNTVQHLIGPRRDTLYIVVPITIIYFSIFLTGMIGNVSTCIIIARNKSMHTATNYYLFSLAISDLLLLIAGLPVEIYSVWSKYPYIFGEGFCILRGLAAECSTYASVLTITAFTVERYVAICHPFLSHTMSKLSRAIKLILIIWLVALCFAIPQALQFGIVEDKKIDPDFIICTLRTVYIEHSFEFSTFLFFIIPMTVITVLYIMIGLKLRKSNMMKKKNNVRSQRGGSCNQKWRRECRNRGRSSRRVLKMLVAVVVAFFICWAPFHVQRLIAIHGTRNDHVTSKNSWMENLYIIFTYISGVLYFVSTTINPILYNIMSNKFREAFMETLARSCGGSSTEAPTEPRSYSSLSRSHQRPVGIFGSRTIGTGGTAVAQESSDCSGNSIHEESPRQSTSVAPGQPEITRTYNSPCLTVQTNHRGFLRVSPDSIPGSKSDRINKVNISDSKASPINRKNFDDRTRTSSASKVRISLTTMDLQQTTENEKQNGVVKYLGLDSNSVENDNANREIKWWRFIKWLSTPKTFKLTTGSTIFGDNNTDVRSNREEYSMTSCYVPADHRRV